jgi:O-acetyl-ADP-ribose deacetylase (regulator of RNase III)
VLCDLDPKLVSAWQGFFAAYPSVSVQQGDILALKGDAIISPANSFGFMDGGIDLAYSKFFGWSLQKQLQTTLLNEFGGELPVGQAVILPTGNPQVPNLISAPTMRVPMDIAGTVNAYLAFRAALRSVQAFNATSSTPLSTILCPGLGTGAGKMPPNICARQMLAAYLSVQHPTVPFNVSNAVDLHFDLLADIRP